MRRIPRPSPATVIALIALFVALGGTGYAIVHTGIPDTKGVFHGCVNRSTGALRLVKSAAQCVRREFAVAWSQAGPRGASGRNGTNGQNGTTISARIRGTGSLTTGIAQASFPVSPTTFAQGATELDTVVGGATVQTPSSTDCNEVIGTTPFPATLNGQLLVDGTAIGSITASTGQGTQNIVFLPTGPGLTLFEPGGSGANHTVQAEFSDGCGLGGGAAVHHFVVTSVKVDVEAAR